MPTCMTLCDSERLAIEITVGARSGEIIEGTLGHADDVIAHERRAFPRAILGMLDRALPLHDGPAGIVVLCQLREDRLEVNLPVAERAKTSGPIDPVLITAVHAGFSGRAELSVLDVKNADEL